jgi:hypothetical protein
MEESGEQCICRLCINCYGTELEFLKSLLGLGTKEKEGYRNGPPGYIGWWNSFLGIDSGAPYKFKNPGSGGLGVTTIYTPPPTSFEVMKL